MGAITRNFANNILESGQLDATDGVSGNVPTPNVNNESLDNITALPSSVGFGVKTVSSDPPSLNAGEIFFNSTDGVFKSLIFAKSWSAGGKMTTARYGPGGGGTTTAGLVFGGYTGTAQSNLTEEYNGTGHSNGGNLGTARSGNAGTGTQTAGLSAGGVNPPSQYVGNVEEYDGSSWSEVNDLPTAKGYMLQGGTQTATFVGGGRQGPPYSNPTATLEYDGTNWTSGGTLGVANYHGSSGGTLTAGWNLGGSPGPGAAPGRTNTSQFYDGTSWTAGPNGPTEINSGSGAGSQTAALAFTNGDASNTGGNNILYEYDGSSWAVSPATLGTARRSGGRGGMGTTANQALAMGGRIGTPATDVTEEFNVSINTITAAAWASGGNLNTVRNVLAGVGTQTAALMIGGNNPGTTQKGNVEQYDGSSYTEINDLTTARSQGGSAGTSTAALFFGGDIYPSSPRDTAKTEEYSGSSWSEQNDMVGTARRALIGFGTQTAAVGAGGYGGGILALTEEYNGTSWTAGNAMPVAKESLAAGGSQTAGLTFGGYAPPGPAVVKTTEEYDGTNWTSGGSLNTGRWGAGRGTVGSQTACLAFGGDSSSPSVQSATENYDGTSWSTRPGLATARRASGGAGTPTAALCSGGYSSTNVNTTEEFTGETSAQVAKTIQSS